MTFLRVQRLDISPSLDPFSTSLGELVDFVPPVEMQSSCKPIANQFLMLIISLSVKD